ncbi:indolethylamine N-methyltransferase-like [Aquarana catesbeiana]|uniref:indolethylamine N-methyltransferase-like n=1 Tax=Aquarana catesbeiana TaxID=8400 RepID=UPI003CCA2164
MDSTTHQFYHIHGWDSRDDLDLYYSNKEDMVFANDTLKFPMESLHYHLNSGQVKGTFMIDISAGSFIHHLLSASNCFQKIIILKLQEKCIMEVTRWLHDRTGAYDWTHASGAAAVLEGTREQLQETEMRLRSSVKQILKCDFEQEDITSPVQLPLADCIISALILESISKNEDEYMKNLEKILKMLKCGGQLLLFGLVDSTYKTVKGKRIHRFKCNEEFVKNALGKLGLVIDYYAVKTRSNVSDLTDYRAVLFIVAHKGE